MRWILLGVILLCSSLTRAADGEFRLIYAGNLAAANQAQREALTARLAALRTQGNKDGVPSLLLLPGTLCAPGTATVDQDRATLTLAASLSPAAVGIGAQEWQDHPAYLHSLRPPSLPWVSVNAKPHDVVVVPTRIMDVGPVRIGIVGLSLAPGALPDKRLRGVLATAITRLHARCDILVLLGSFDAVQAPCLSTLCPEADIVLGGAGESSTLTSGTMVLAGNDDTSPFYGQLDVAVREGRLAACRGWMHPIAPTTGRTE